MNTIPVAEVTRGGIVESEHRGAVAVVTATGRLLAFAGDPHLVTFLRSSSKPLQAIPAIETGAADAAGLNPRHLALMCGSHGADPDHTAAVSEILAAAGRAERDLQCGTHPPLDPAVRERFAASHTAPTQLHHNCSGKHAGMLVLAQHLHAPRDLPYTDVTHPVQQRILAAVADMAGLPASEIVLGIDGCSVPNFAMPLNAAARAFARLLNPDGLAPDRAAAALRLADAMRAYPKMVSWESGFDTRLMQAVPGIVSKGGAEAYHAMALPAGMVRDEAIGIALKIADGASRARDAVALAVLAQLGLAIPSELADLVRPEVRNWRGMHVGEIRPVVRLQFA